MSEKEIKRFKDYVEDYEKPKYAFNAHGSHAKQKKPKYAFNVHGSHAKQKISESVEHKPASDFIKNDLNKDHINGATSEEQMSHLHDLHPFKSEEARQHLRQYTEYSGDLNKALLRAKQNELPAPTTVEKHDVKGLDDSFTPSKTTLHTYSGLGFDPREVHHEGKSKAGNPVFMSPTFLSTSHNKRVAMSFARDNKPYGATHAQILHIETRPGQHIGVIGSHSHYPGESETIMPRDEHYEHLGTTTYSHNIDDVTHTYEVHHVRRIPKSEVIKD